MHDYTRNAIEIKVQPGNYFAGSLKIIREFKFMGFRVSHADDTLAFSRKQILEFVVLNLNAVVANLDRIVPLRGEDIKVITHLNPLYDAQGHMAVQIVPAGRRRNGLARRGRSRTIVQAC